MTNKVGIGIEARFDTAGVDAGVQKIAQKITQANRTQYNPVSDKTVKVLDAVNQRFQQLLRVDGELRRRMKSTGQAGAPFESVDLSSMYPDSASRKRKAAAIDRYMGINGPQPGPAPGGGGGRGGFGAMAGNAAQAGLRAAGPVGGVAAGALGTGMSAGFGAGLMGLMGGMLALGVGKLVGAAMEKIDQAEKNSVGMDTLKRQLGDVNVSFNALKAVVNGSADNLKITYDEAGRLASQFTKLGNVSGEQYKTLSDELNVGVGMSRAFGMDPSAGVGVMGQMRGIGVTSNVQDSRRFALLIGETIGKSNAFAKSEEVMDALASYATSQTRNNMGRANVEGYAGMFSGMVGSGIPGMDPAGSAALLGKINASLSAGGAKGEASQFFSGMVGAGMGLNPYQTKMLREGGAFATKDSMFGEGSAYAKYKGLKPGDSRPTGDTTWYQESIGRLKKSYGEGSDELADATANHLGIGVNQAMGLLSLKPNQMGDLSKKYGDLRKFSSVSNLAQIEYGTAEDRQGVARGLLGRRGQDAISSEDRKKIEGATTDDQLKQVLGDVAAKYDQERTQGSDIRDSKNALDNIKTAVADKLVPLMTDMRLGIMHIAGGKDGKSPKQIMAEVMTLESKDRVAGIKGDFEAQRKGAVGESESIRIMRDKAVADLRKNYNSMAPEDIAKAQKRITELSDQYAIKSEEVRNRLIELMKKEADAIEAETKLRDEKITEMRKASLDGSDPEITGSINQSAAETGRLGRIGRPPVGGGSGGGGGGGAAAPDTFDDLFAKYGKQYGVDPRILKAIAMKESSMRPGAVGGVNRNGTRDYGLMQHNSAFLSERGLTDDWKNPERSIEEAAKLLKKNTEKTGGVRSGVRAYNGSGPAAEAYAADIMGRVDGTKINEGTPLPGGGAGRGSVNPSYNVSADDITVRVVDASGRPMAPPQQIQTRVQPNWRPSMTY